MLSIRIALPRAAKRPSAPRRPRRPRTANPPSALVALEAAAQLAIEGDGEGRREPRLHALVELVEHDMGHVRQVEGARLRKGDPDELHELGLGPDHATGAMRD